MTAPPGQPGPAPAGLGAGYWRMFAADTVSSIGTVVSTLAIQFLLIDTLQADEQAIGLVSAAQWAPYLVFGLLAGVIAERVRRKPLLVAADLLGMAIFGAIGLLALAGRLTVPIVAGLVFAFGAVTCVSDAAYQSYVPRLVPERALPDAFACLEQMGQVLFRHYFIDNPEAEKWEKVQLGDYLKVVRGLSYKGSFLSDDDSDNPMINLGSFAVDGTYNGGNIKGSKNIPLQSLNQNLGKINKNKPVITCCASGARSAAAKSILKNSGFTEVYNGGGWSSLKSKIS